MPTRNDEELELESAVAAKTATKPKGGTAVVTFDDDGDETVLSRSSCSAASTITMSAWEGLWKRHNHNLNNADGGGAGVGPRHQASPLEPPRTPRPPQDFGVTVRSKTKSSARRRDDDRFAAAGPTPKSSRNLRDEDDDDDKHSLQQFWEDQWSVAHQIHGRLRQVRSNLACSNTNGGVDSWNVRRDVDLLKSLLAIQAAQTQRLLDHLPKEEEELVEEKVEHVMKQQTSSTSQMPALLMSRGILPVDPNYGQREHEKDDEEKKVDLEDPTPQRQHPGRHSEVAPLANAPAEFGAADAVAAATEGGGAEWSLLGRMQQHHHHHQQQQLQQRAGFCTRLATLEEVEYESDRTTPSNAAAATATPATTPALSFPSGAQSGISSASRGAAAASGRGASPAEPDRTTPASTTTTPGNVRRGGGMRSTPGQHRHHPSPQSMASYSSTPRRSSYVDAPSDEMDSGMWERESNRTIDTYDMSSSATPRQPAASPSHLRNYQAAEAHPKHYQANRESVGAGGSYGDTQSDQDEDDDEYDSALYCATVLASDRDGRHVRIRSPTHSQGSEAGERHRYDRPEEPQLPGVHSTPSSAFRNKVVVVDYSENQPSPTMTNITMDESEFNDVEEEEGGGGAKRGARRNAHDLMYVNDASTEVDDSRDTDSGTHEDDNTTTTSQETPVLERYRIDLDDESPHGFTVIPNPRGLRRRSLHGSSPKVGVMLSTSRTPSHQPAATLLQKASAAFDVDVGFSSNEKSNGNTASGEHEWLASPNHLDALLHQPLSARRRSTRKALRKSPYKPPKMVPSTPTIDENAPLSCPGDLAGLSSVERHRRREPEYETFVESGRLQVPLEGSRSNATGHVNRPHTKSNESLVPLYDPSLLPAAFVLYANAQLSLLDANQQHQSRRSFDYSDFRQAESSPRDQKVQAAPVVIPPLTEDEYNNSRCIARSGITLEEAQLAIAALNRVLQSRASAPSPGRPGLLPNSVDRSVLRSSNGPVNRGHESTSSPLRTHFREHEAKRILMQALDVSDRKSKTILVGLCHWRRLILRRQSFGGGGAGGGNDGRGGSDDNGSTSSSTTLSLLLYEVPTTKPRENLSLA
jgi:hypothetical protein